MMLAPVITSGATHRADHPFTAARDDAGAISVGNSATGTSGVPIDLPMLEHIRTHWDDMRVDNAHKLPITVTPRPNLVRLLQA